MQLDDPPLSCQKTLRNGNKRGNPAHAPRCGAKTRAGHPCKAPAVRGKIRCRMHGGTKGTGAPKGNQNAYKHGCWTADVVAGKWFMRDLIRECRKNIRSTI